MGGAVADARGRRAGAAAQQDLPGLIQGDAPPHPTPPLSHSVTRAREVAGAAATHWTAAGAARIAALDDCGSGEARQVKDAK